MTGGFAGRPDVAAPDRVHREAKASGPSGREGRERTQTREPRNAIGRVRLLALCVVLGVWTPAAAQLTAPELYRGVGFDQKLGQQLPLDLSFTDEAGRRVRLEGLFGRRPVVLALVYYECPMLCTLVLDGLVRSLKRLSFEAGKDFDVLAVSFDPRDTPERAAAKKRAYLERYGRPETAEGWHFLSGEAESIAKLTEAIGFRATYDAGTGEFAHAGGLLLLTPQGRISRLFYGIEYPVQDLRLGLVEASAGRLGTAVDHLILLCYRYDPATGRYGLVILNVLRLAGLLTVAALGLMLYVLHSRDRRRLGH
jgi:protein SCO1/2